MKIIIGLGNPGKEYHQTRHNAGRMAAQYFARKNDFPEFEFSKKYQSLIADKKIKDEKFLLLLPETFMNHSSKAVKGLPPKNLTIIHDDIDLPLGKLKISFGRGSGGHKGVESIIRTLKTKDFWRIRIGVAPKKKPPQKEIPKFLLSDFKPSELKELQKIFKKIEVALI
ncbi:MAG: aminoacyl-tRNA hydrolase [Patescibacteria group bacterium]